MFTKKKKLIFVECFDQFSDRFFPFPKIFRFPLRSSWCTFIKRCQRIVDGLKRAFLPGQNDARNSQTVFYRNRQLSLAAGFILKLSWASLIASFVDRDYFKRILKKEEKKHESFDSWETSAKNQIYRFVNFENANMIIECEEIKTIVWISYLGLPYIRNWM